MKWFSTGPVENAAANPSISTWIKILNNNNTETVNAELVIYSLNGEKVQIGSNSLSIPSFSSEYEVFDITDILQYEIQIGLSITDNVLISIWGKDADANFTAVHRFVHRELSSLDKDGSSKNSGNSSNLTVKKRRKSSFKNHTR